MKTLIAILVMFSSLAFADQTSQLLRLTDEEKLQLSDEQKAQLAEVQALENATLLYNNRREDLQFLQSLQIRQLSSISQGTYDTVGFSADGRSYTSYSAQPDIAQDALQSADFLKSVREEDGGFLNSMATKAQAVYDREKARALPVLQSQQTQINNLLQEDSHLMLLNSRIDQDISALRSEIQSNPGDVTLRERMATLVDQQKATRNAIDKLKDQKTVVDRQVTAWEQGDKQLNKKLFAQDDARAETLKNVLDGLTTQTTQVVDSAANLEQVLQQADSALSSYASSEQAKLNEQIQDHEANAGTLLSAQDKAIDKARNDFQRDQIVNSVNGILNNQNQRRLQANFALLNLEKWAEESGTTVETLKEALKQSTDLDNAFNNTPMGIYVNKQISKALSTSCDMVQRCKEKQSPDKIFEDAFKFLDNSNREAQFGEQPDYQGTELQPGQTEE